MNTTGTGSACIPKTRPLIRGTRSVAAICVVALVLAGCGDSDDSPPDDETLSEAVQSFAEVDATDEYQSETWANYGEPITDVTFLPDGSALVATKGGWDTTGTAKVLHVDADGVQIGTALELPVCPQFERGLVGLIADPDFATNQSVFAYYTRQMGECWSGSPGEIPPAGSEVYNRLSRFTFDAGSLTNEEILIDGIPSFNGAHNGGGMDFDSEGHLFLGVGDGQLVDNSPKLNEWGGKVLRLDLDSPDLAPADNPFPGSQPQSLVYAKGFRNPFGIAVDPEDSTLIVGDVGDDAFEEINVVAAGGDYGWPASEGPSEEGDQPSLYYEHNDGCIAIISGPVLGGEALGAETKGQVAFADFGCGKLWAADREAAEMESARLIADGLGNVTRLRQAPDGSLLVLTSDGNRHTRLKRLNTAMKVFGRRAHDMDVEVIGKKFAGSLYVPESVGAGEIILVIEAPE